MTRICMIPECNFEQLIPDVSCEVRSQLWALWLEDLSAKMDKDDLIVGANGLLTYFGSKVLVTDVDWDNSNSCFIWEVEIAS